MKSLQWSPVLTCALLVACVAATTPAPPTYARFLGNWSCETENGSQVAMAYTVSKDGALDLHAPWKHGAKRGWTDHRIVQSPDGTWSATYTNSSGGTFKGSSPGLVDDRITFTGVQVLKGQNDTSRETFHLIGDNRLDHIWEMQTDKGAWLQVSASHCTRS
jgi:hypothetical protein